MQNKEDNFDAALKQLTFNTSEHQYEFQRAYVSFLPVFSALRHLHNSLVKSPERPVVTGTDFLPEILTQVCWFLYKGYIWKYNQFHFLNSLMLGFISNPFISLSNRSPFTHSKWRIPLVVPQPEASDCVQFCAAGGFIRIFHAVADLMCLT